MSDIIIQWLLGTVIGAGVVGSSVQRTLSVSRGDVAPTVLHSLLNSAFYYFSVTFIARDNLHAYLGTCVGSTIVVVYMVLRVKLRKQQIEGLNENKNK